MWRKVYQNMFLVNFIMIRFLYEMELEITIYHKAIPYFDL